MVSPVQRLQHRHQLTGTVLRFSALWCLLMRAYTTTASSSHGYGSESGNDYFVPDRIEFELSGSSNTTINVAAASDAEWVSLIHFLLQIMMDLLLCIVLTHSLARWMVCVLSEIGRECQIYINANHLYIHIGSIRVTVCIITSALVAASMLLLPLSLSSHACCCNEKGYC
jgi:hypothetical protein